MAEPKITSIITPFDDAIVKSKGGVPISGHPDSNTSGAEGMGLDEGNEGKALYHTKKVGSGSGSGL